MTVQFPAHLSSAENPRFLLRPWRMLSPSSSAVRRPRSYRACSSVHATVLLPEPLKPVNLDSKQQAHRADLSLLSQGLHQLL